MPFREATGRETCNDCRCRVGLGAPVYVGERTPGVWCAACAEANLGRTPDGPVPAKLPADAWGGFDIKAMGARLREKILARRNGLRDVSARIVGERE